MKYIYIIAFSLLALTSWSQEEMTLPKAISIGLENNFGLKIAETAVFIAQNNNSWARAGRVPTVDLNGSFTNNFTNDNNPASFLQGTYYNGSLGANVSAGMVLYGGGRVRISKDLLELSVNQAQLNRQIEVHNLINTIYDQYYQVIFLEEQKEVLEQSLTLSKDRLEYENARKEFGTSNTYNLVQFESSVMSDSMSILSLDQQIEASKRTLLTTLNILDYPNYEFTENLSVTPEDISRDKLRDVMTEENYTLKSLEMLASLNRLNTKLAEAANRLNVTMNTSAGYARNAFKFFGENPQTGEPVDLLFSSRITGGVNVNATYNLYDGGVRSTDIQNARLQEEMDQLSIEEARAQIYNQLDLLIANHKNQKDQLALSTTQLNLTKQNLEIAEERFKAGQITSLDYRNIQLQYLNAAFAKAGIIYQLILTQNDIDYLVGRYAN